MRKVLCIFIVLSVLFIVAISSSALSVASYSLSEETPSVADAIKEYDRPVETHRYYFQVPDGNNGPVAVEGKLKGMKYPSWLNSCSDTDSDGELDFGPAVYWYDMKDCPNPDSWVGYRVEKGDAHGIYYADVPVNVTELIWNNGLFYEMDDERFSLAQSSCLIGCEYYEPGENMFYPAGIEDFDNMICIINPDRESDLPEEPDVYGVVWYYYYGDGHYGLCAPVDFNVEKDFIEEKCINPDHKHVKSEMLYGDVDEDTSITIADSTRIQQYLVNLSPSVFNVAAADTDDDKNVTIADATIIQQFLAKIPNRFKVGESLK